MTNEFGERNVSKSPVEYRGKLKRGQAVEEEDSEAVHAI